MDKLGLCFPFWTLFHTQTTRSSSVLSCLEGGRISWRGRLIKCCPRLSLRPRLSMTGDKGRRGLIMGPTWALMLSTDRPAQMERSADIWFNDRMTFWKSPSQQGQPEKNLAKQKHQEREPAGNTQSGRKTHCFPTSYQRTSGLLGILQTLSEGRTISGWGEITMEQFNNLDYIKM